MPFVLSGCAAGLRGWEGHRDIFPFCGETGSALSESFSLTGKLMLLLLLSLSLVRAFGLVGVVVSAILALFLKQLLLVQKISPVSIHAFAPPRAPLEPTLEGLSHVLPPELTSAKSWRIPGATIPTGSVLS